MMSSRVPLRFNLILHDVVVYLELVMKEYRLLPGNGLIAGMDFSHHYEL